MSSEEIAIGSDHAGVELKNRIKALLSGLGMVTVDYGTGDVTSVDYPDFGERVAKAVSTGQIRRGILICGTGLGMSIVANKFPGVRAALCHDTFTARMSRLHNDSNILVLGSRVLKEDAAEEIVRTWLETPFEGGRHELRINKITTLEKRLKNDS